MVRFEGELEKGIYSLYISEFAEWIEDFEISTTVKKVAKNGTTLEKPTYEDFSVSEIGFYIYGKNLNVKDIVKWFNKNMISVSLGT